MKYSIIENGKVVNQAVADEPIAENWIPAGDSKRGDLWDGSVFTSPPPIQYPLSEHRQRAIGTVVDRQYLEADKGTAVASLPVATTIDSIAEITGAVQGNGRNPANMRKINLRGGRVQMNKAQLEGLADAVDGFRQLCHDRGYDICELIDAAVDQTAIDAVLAAELNTGWPV